MKKINIRLIYGICILLSISACERTEIITDYTIYVNPFIGTAGHGHTYPGASMPFGMVQLSPDTRLSGWDGCSGYHYSDSIIYGFSHTHLSGTGCSDYGDILLMPAIGNILKKEKRTDDNYWFQSGFSHDNEVATPGYYNVILDDYNIYAEFTVTERVGFHKYQFPNGTTPVILIDLLHRDQVVESNLKIVNDYEVEGLRRSRAWAKDQYVYFVARFSKPISTAELYENDSIISESFTEGKATKCLLRFENEENNNLVMVKVALSAVSTSGARKNLEAEIPEWDFNNVKEKARQKWNDQLKKIVVEGGTRQQKRIFYTALYHSFLNPNLYMDVDGSYRGTDLKVHQSDEFVNYTVFSLWDTYRATHPLFTIIEQKRTIDFINTFLKQYENGGQLPVWELAANYTGCMIGYHSIPVIVDAYIKGLNGFDQNKAFEAMMHSADADHLGLAAFKQFNFIPGDMEHESVSKTLEYAYDDWCIAMMARELGKEEEYRRYIQRAQAYKNIFNPETGFMQAKMNNQWITPFDASEVNFHFTEANSWQYSFYVPQDVLGLIKIRGGKEAFIQKLETLFSVSSQTSGREQADITGLIGQYAHGNEPSHHMAYLYNYVNQPWNTQKRVRQIVDELYTDHPDGLCGNEDCGQMSSWYVFSAMGFYPVCPGTDYYVIGTPIFNKVTIHLENGKSFEIHAKKVSEKNIYIKNASLNGKVYSRNFLSHKEILKGGKLEFNMISNPSKEWGNKDGDIPPSMIKDELITQVPYVKNGNRTFTKSTIIRLDAPDQEAKIYYTIDGTEPDMESTVYKAPIEIDESTILKAFAFSVGFLRSNTIISEFTKIAGGRDIQLISIYSKQYTGGGDHALIDYARGSDNFRLGAWQGYQYDDLEAIIDLGSKQQIHKIAAGFLQDMDSWIWFPSEIEYSISSDNQTFEVLGSFKNTFPLDEDGAHMKEFPILVKNTQARYIKVIARNLKYCPEWHPGAGGKAWIFIDEIIVE
ncbi:GH92 family glycosyl hydrolase [candidate division KSB1 bacterium]